MSGLSFIGILIMLSQLIYSQDNRCINLHYVRPMGYIEVEISIKNDSNSYKIISSIKQINDKHEIITNNSEIEITKDEFQSYYSRLMNLDKKTLGYRSYYSGVKKLDKIKANPNDCHSFIEEDNLLKIDLYDNQNYFTIELWHITKYDDVRCAYNKLLLLLEELFQRIGLLPGYLYMHSG